MDTHTDLKLAVQEEKVGKCLGRKATLLQEKLHLLKPFSGFLLHVHEGLVVEGHHVQLFLQSGRHVCQRILPRLNWQPQGGEGGEGEGRGGEKKG